MTVARAFIAGVVVLAIVTVIGTVGFVLVEYVGLFDALYTTVITISNNRQLT